MIETEPLSFIVPGALSQLTGGYLFDRRVIEGLRASGRKVTVIELPGNFCEVDGEARSAARTALAGLQDGALVAIDGLALLAFDECLESEAARLRVVIVVHHALADETGLDERERRHIAAAEARLLATVRGVLCPSDNSAAAVAAYGVPSSSIAVTPPGTVKPVRLRRKRPHRGPLELLCVGTLTPRKGHRLLVEALDALADRDWHCRCIGSLTRDPDTAAATSYEIGRRGLKGRISLAGEWPPELMAKAYAAADAFVLPSYHEGYGMAFAEALAHGLPIIATTGGAIPQTVPRNAGLLVPPGDVVGLTSALACLLDDAKLRAKLGAGARAAGAKLSDWPKAVACWAAALDRLSV